MAIFLHNAPCSGVEATVGLGAGLDVFESVVNILKELKKNGYKKLLNKKLIGKIKEINGAEEIVNSKENFIEGVEKLKDY
ncbi:cobaltochelatase subunit CobN [Clostridium cochlearium]|uniref:cobaltochelatase subunit CobN n=1 Tax=Clostridium cochlearium TaxID=1494 RepID=UPI000B94FC9C|nr:cobaltochelatase subunit CobN [Clostridium cochlearium]SNV74786.1 cobaltochelatase subunit CobN [Clostridium cochlearium]STA92340.1 cobaltochelatase subunit CobN [Clostridium cochlearium]